VDPQQPTLTELVTDDQETPQLVNVTLSVTVPGEHSPAVVARFGDCLQAALTDSGGVAFSRISLSAYAETPDSEE
jgi:hypothetical protein